MNYIVSQTGIWSRWTNALLIKNVLHTLNIAYKPDAVNECSRFMASSISACTSVKNYCKGNCRYGRLTLENNQWNCNPDMFKASLVQHFYKDENKVMHFIKNREGRVLGIIEKQLGKQGIICCYQYIGFNLWLSEDLLIILRPP